MGEEAIVPPNTWAFLVQGLCSPLGCSGVGAAGMQTSASLLVAGAENPTCFHCRAEVSNCAANIWGRGSAPKPTGAAQTPNCRARASVV